MTDENERRARALVVRRSQAQAKLEGQVFRFQQIHELSDIDLLDVLAGTMQTVLKYRVRQEDEDRTGYRRRLAGE